MKINGVESGIYSGTFSRDTAAGTEDVGYTGVGFKPCLILFNYLINSSAIHGNGFWSSKGLAGGGYVTTTTGGIWYNAPPIDVYPVGGGRQYGALKSFDVDGFTISWTRTNNPTGIITVHYVCFLI